MAIGLLEIMIVVGAVMGVIGLVAMLSGSSKSAVMKVFKIAGLILLSLFLAAFVLIILRLLLVPVAIEGPVAVAAMPKWLLLIGAALLIAFLLARMLSRPAGRKALVVLIVLACIAGLGLFGFKQVPFQQAHPVEVQVAPGSLVSGTIWSQNIEEQFAADSYSSVSAAAAGLGAGLELSQEPNDILLVEGSASNELLNDFRRGLHRQFENADIYINTLPGGPPRENQAFISLSKEENPGGELTIHRGPGILQSFSSGMVKGKLEATLHTSKGKYIQQAAFDYRPWLWDTSGFIAKTPQGRWLVTASEETATTPEEARAQALQKAVEVLGAGLRADPLSSHLQPQLNPADLEQHGLIVDQYAQKLQGLAGPIWRHAILLEVSPERLAQLQNQKNQVLRSARHSWARLIGSFAGMIAMICVVYVFLNAATKGYYARALVVFSVLLAAGLGVIILMFIR